MLAAGAGSKAAPPACREINRRKRPVRDGRALETETEPMQPFVCGSEPSRVIFGAEAPACLGEEIERRDIRRVEQLPRSPHRTNTTD
ncbi:hypothetical protein MesoLjLc_55770 [Mesorhizobium sp. L-8-10]|nr:hypothetical protein MesoLjLb_54370 [Mesorhizobium sp. L-8-3]BCH33647.1 hypothetical protein MesoLjLc_55770 [Mesorhizobium sp. L-8-10]